MAFENFRFSLSADEDQSSPLDEYLWADDPRTQMQPQDDGLQGEDSGLLGFAESLWTGGKNLLEMGRAAGNTLTGDYADVEAGRERFLTNEAESTLEKRQFMQDYMRRNQADKEKDGDVSWLDAIGNLASSAWENKMGFGHAMAEQAPNAAPVLLAGAAGAKLGAMGGTAVAPGLGTAIGAIGGGFLGMALGNAGIEVGSKAIQAAEGGLTEQEADTSIREGAIKGSVIAGVDMATLGIGGAAMKALGKTAVKAGAMAEAKVLMDAGVDVTNPVNIARAFENAELRSAALAAGEAAAKANLSLGQKTIAAGTGLSLETFGEGAGEYLGELAATGKGDKADAVLEAFMGAGQSSVETAWNFNRTLGNKVDIKGILEAGSTDEAIAYAQEQLRKVEEETYGTQADSFQTEADTTLPSIEQDYARLINDRRESLAQDLTAEQERALQATQEQHVTDELALNLEVVDYYRDLSDTTLEQLVPLATQQDFSDRNELRAVLIERGIKLPATTQVETDLNRIDPDPAATAAARTVQSERQTFSRQDPLATEQALAAESAQSDLTPAPVTTAPPKPDATVPATQEALASEEVPTPALSVTRNKNGTYEFQGSPEAIEAARDTLSKFGVKSQHELGRLYAKGKVAPKTVDAVVQSVNSRFSESRDVAAEIERRELQSQSNTITGEASVPASAQAQQAAPVSPLPEAPQSRNTLPGNVDTDQRLTETLRQRKGWEGTAREVIPGQTARQVLGTRQTSKPEAAVIRTVGKLFGTDIRFFETDAPTPDGFYRSGKTVWVNVNSGVSALTVAGHEFTHSLKAQDAEAHAALVKGVRAILESTPDRVKSFSDYYDKDNRYGWRDAEGNIRQDLADTDYDHIAEEVASDLNGDMWRDSGYWRDVFDEINRAHRPSMARKFITSIVTNLTKLIDKLIVASPKQGFSTAEKIGLTKDELVGIRGMLVTEMKNAFIREETARVKGAPMYRGDGLGEGAVLEAPKRTEIDSSVWADRGENAADRQYDLGIAKGQRAKKATATLTPVEKTRALSSAQLHGFKPAEVEAEIRSIKTNYPASEGWAQPEFNQIAEKGDNLNSRIEFNEIPYSFHIPPNWTSDKAPNPHSAQSQPWVNEMAARVTKEVAGLTQRAKQGDKVAKTIIDHMTWYREMARRLRDEFGGFGDAFADLLGATSPNTPVRTNWNFSVDALRRFVRGEFDEKLKAYEDAIAAGIGPKEFREKFGDQLLTQITGSQYGINSVNAAKALVGMWRAVKKGDAPKARNFALNLIGQSDKATIDVWAARMLQRLAKRDRVPPKAEGGVSGNHASDVSKVTGQFGFGQLVFDKAVASLRKQGIDITAPDLQAVAWFLEKELWTKNGWTRGLGSEGSFEQEADKMPVDRYQAGATIAQYEKVPTDAEMAQAGDEMTGALKGDPDVIAYRALPTVGMYAGDKERSFDQEVIAKQGWSPANWIADVVKKMKATNQYDSFFSRVLRPNENHANARPGVEVYFKTEQDLAKVQPMLDKIVANGIDGFTLAVSPLQRRNLASGKEADTFIGVRLQYVPEIAMRWMDKNSEEYRKLTSGDEAQVQEVLDQKRNQIDAAVHDLNEFTEVAFAKRYEYDTLVVGKENYDAYSDPKSGRVDQVFGKSGQDRSISERLKAAASRLEGKSRGVSPGDVLQRSPDGAEQQSAGRPDAASSTGVGSGLASPVKASESREGAVSATGIHYSHQPRKTLTSSSFGTGLKGAEMERVQTAQDERLRHRIYFYVNTGRGINPESGVGHQAHRADLSNLYDATADALDLRVGRDANEFESAVLDAGFDGYMTQASGIAILLGQRALPVEHIGTGRPEADRAGQAEPSAYQKALKAVADNKSLPSGQMTGAEWKATMAKRMPEIDVSHLADDQMYYKSGIVAKPEVTRFSEASRDLDFTDDRRVPQEDYDEILRLLTDDDTVSVKELTDEEADAAETVFLSNLPEGARKFNRGHPLARRLRKASDAAASELGGKATTTLERNAPLGQFSGYRTTANVDEDGTLNVEVWTKEQIDEGLTAEPTLTFNVTPGSELIVNGPSPLGKTFKEMKKRGWMEEATDAKGNVVPGWTRVVEDVPFGQLVKLLGEVHARARINKRISHMGLRFHRSTAAKALTDIAGGGAFFSEFRAVDTNSPEFKRWFGDSKVVDEDGKPLRVYHGTAGDVTEFDQRAMKNGEGFYFSKTHKTANSWAKRSDGNVMPVFLAIKNPAPMNEYQAAVRNSGFDGAKWVADLKSQGYDGVVGKDIIIAFSPTQIKSAISNTGEFSDTNPDIRYSEPRNQPWYYSALEDGVRNQVPKHLQTQTGKSWAAWLTGNYNKIGAKKDELEWSGVLDWLPTTEGKLTSAQVADWLAENGVRVEEVVLHDNELREWSVHDPETRNRRKFSTEEAARKYADEEGIGQEWVSSVLRSGTAKHASGNLVLPGGTDHREIVLTVPTIEPYNESDTTHYGDTGKGKAIAWARVNTRTDADGNKVLFVEEIQSQRGQHGRKRGFAQLAKDTEEAARDWHDMSAGLWNSLSQRERDSLRQEYRDQGIAENDAGVPVAPFVSTKDGKPTDAYIALTLKRLIAYAVDNGFDGVAWVTGEQTADRYDLSKQVEAVYAQRNSDGTYNLAAETPAGDYPNLGERVSANQVEEYVGKELAEKIIKQPDGQHIYRDLDLKVGGGWTASFYGDSTGNNAQGKPSMIAAAARKLGAEVGRVELDNREPGSEAWFETLQDEDVLNQPGFPITDAMREQASGKGMPLFSESRNNVAMKDPSSEEANYFEQALEGKSLIEAAQFMANDPKVSEANRLIAKKVQAKLILLKAAGIDTRFTIAHVGDSVPVGLLKARGYTVESWKKGEEYMHVWLNGADVTGKVGVRESTVMHELIHAATMTAIRFGNLTKNKGTKTFDTVGDLLDVHNAVIREFNRRIAEMKAGRYTLTEFEQEMYERNNNAFRDPDETLAWAMTSPQAQTWLEGISYKGKSLWTTFVQAVRTLLNLNPSADTALSEIMRVSEVLLDEDLIQRDIEAAMSNLGYPLRTQQAVDRTVAINPGTDPDKTPPSGGVSTWFAEARSAITGNPIDAQWQSPKLSGWDAVVEMFQDKQRATKQVMAALKEKMGDIYEGFDPYLQEILYHGRAAKRVKDFADFELTPLLREMTTRGVTMQDLDDYLWATHATERNAQIARINPAMPDGGSGLTDQQAADILAGQEVTLKDGRKIKLKPTMMGAYAAMGRKIRAINDKTLDALVEYGLESQETVDIWKNAYQNYVPLKRDMEADDNYAGAFGLGSGTGQGFSVRGSASKRALGSNRTVIDILANVAMQRERAIVRGEKNRVAMATYGLAISAPNPNFWLPVNPDATKDPQALAAELQQIGLNSADAENIAREPVQRVINPTTGMVESRINPMLRQRDDVLTTRINGKDRFVFFSNDETAQQMVRNLKNLDAAQLGPLMQMAAPVTRYFASINTQFNPIFGITNGIRDFGTGMLNLSSTALAAKRGEVAKHVLPALRGIYADLRDHRAGKRPTSQWAQLFEEYARAGGQTGYMDSFANSDERGKDIAKAMEEIADGVPLWKLFNENHPIGGWLSDYNTAIENAVRLSAYKVARDQGMTEDKAANLAKNLTVNFNKKGQIATQAGALYAFFNAAVQGTARIGETMVKDGKLTEAGMKIAMGGVLLGVMQAVMAMLAGWDDEEPPQFIREKNFLIPTGDGKYISVPMPLGFHVLPNIGRIAAEMALGGFRKPGERMTQMAKVIMDAFNPLGSSTALQTGAPTVLDPLVALGENKDWAGKPIYREDFNKMKPTPGWTRTKDTASDLSKALSYGINYVTGGGKYEMGLASPTPDQIDYLIGVATGGVGRESLKAWQAGKAQVSGEDLPPHKVPGLGRFYGSTTGQSSEMSKFYSNLKRIGAHDTVLDRMKEAKDSAARAEYLAEHPDAKMVSLADKASREINYWKRQKRDALEAGNAEKVKQIESKITTLVKVWNARLGEKPVTEASQ